MRNLSQCTSANNTSPSYTPYSVPLQVEGITLLEAVLIVTGNFLTIGLFATERKIRKKSLFLVVNMAFADLISGAISLPLYAYLSIRPSYRLWHHCRHHLLFLVLFVLVTLVFAELSTREKFLHNRETEHLKANACCSCPLLLHCHGFL